MGNIIIKPLAPKTANVITVKAIEAVCPIIRLEYSAGLPGGGGGSAPMLAANIEYDNAQSGLPATNVQGAIDAVVTRLNTHTHALVSLSDVSVSGSIPIGYALVWNGSKWVPSAVSGGGGGGGGYLDDLYDVDAPSPLIGDALIWNGSKWVSQNYEKLKYVIKSSSTELSASDCYGKVINNYGQTTDIDIKLPIIEEGMSVMFALGKSINKRFRVYSMTYDYIYFEGVRLSSGCGVYLSSVKAGNAISFMSFYTELNDYYWLAVPISGDWQMEEPTP